MRPRARGCRARSRPCPPREYGSVWDVLTPANRGRLVRAIVERVEVDELKKEVRVFLTDLQSAPSQAVA